MKVKTNGKVFRTVVRPAPMYGAATWALEMAQKHKLDVAEMRMVRRMFEVTKLDNIRNERIRGNERGEHPLLKLISNSCGNWLK